MTSRIDVMCYVDGELDERERARVEAELSESERLGAERAVDQLGDLIRAGAGARAEGFSVVDEVLRRVDSSGAGGARVVSLGARRRPSAAWTLVVTMLGAAAAVALLVTSSGRDATRGVLVGSSTVTPDAVEAGSWVPEPQRPLAEGDGRQGASIEALDTGASVATLFVVQEGPVTTPVVWLDDEDVSHDRMGPL